MVTFKDIENELVVTFEDNVIYSLEKHSIECYPNETGGFIVGKYLTDNHAHVECLVEPTQKNCSPYYFQRSTKGMTKLWDKLYKNGLIYLGEWHTHPNGSSHYSNTDLNTIQSIACNKDIQIIRPLLLILSITDKNIKEISLYHYYDGQLNKMIE